jgi:predicted outer membrane repeat protein
MLTRKMIIGMILAVLVCCMGAVRGVDLGMDGNRDFFQDDTALLGLEAVPGKPAYKPGELLVRFAPKANGIQRNTEEKIQILSSLGGATIKRNFTLVSGLTLVKLPAWLTVKDALKTFNRTDGIFYAEPNYKIYLASTFPDDTRFDELWGMHNIGQDPPGGEPDADIDAPEAWDIANEANDIIVAVIDTGVDYTHPDLEANIWVNEAELNGITGVDDDENDYVDDIYGYDFQGYDVNDQDNNPMDMDWHGTHVAGTVGAVGNNSEGVAGVCWNVKIMVLKIYPPMEKDFNESEAFVSNAIEAIDYAVCNSAKVINASWGFPDPNNDSNYVNSLKDEIEAADANGVLFVAAAHNYGKDIDQDPFYPASFDCNNIISVMATTYNDNRWSKSNYGANSVDIGAPGDYIFSCLPRNEYGYGSGTSMATPHVAGACALVWGMNPALSHLEVKDILLQTVDVIFDPNDGICITNGRLNLYYALVESGTQAGKQAVILNKVDDVNGPVLPDDYITYTISFENTVRGPNDANFPFGDLTNVTIVDHLPAEVDFNNPFDPNYDPNEHTYTWNIGTLQEDDSDSVELTVVVNNLAEPLGKITNVCVIEANEIWPKTVIETTDVNCWDPGIIYVDRDAVAGDNTGMTWEHAYTDLQDALERASNCCANEIWVAEGTYKPTKTSGRSISFDLFDGVAIYGGFDATETARSQRDWVNNVTTLSGDIEKPNDHNDNSYNVVKCADVNNAILDGFTITAGNAKGLIYNAFGGGLYCRDSSNITVRNCIISQNGAHSVWGYGGGICFKDSSNLTLTDCNLTDNTAPYGGALFNISSETNINNCIFSGNSAVLGGGMYNLYEPSPTVSNCTFSNNLADYGGGMYSEDCSPTLTNCIFWGNDAGISGDEIYNDSADPNFAYCDIKGCGAPNDWDPNLGNNDGGNIDEDPCFVNADANDFHLDPNSPCIDVGDPNGDYGGEKDIDGQPRLADGDGNDTFVVDMGADEYMLIYNDNSGLGYINIQDAIYDANDGDTITVTEGTYYENIYFNDQAITIRSKDPNSWSIVEATVIDGNDLGSVVTFDEGESILEGFTIAYGNASEYGGGICVDGASPTIRNCIIRDNYSEYSGGGMYNYGNSTISNCIFRDNESDEDGGGMYIDTGEMTVTNSMFINNDAGYYGGAINNSGTDGYATIINCTFSGNTATDGGGAIYGDSYMTLTNCILWGDTVSGQPDEIYAYPSSPTVTYSDIEGGYSGEGNINSDPLFVDPNNDDFHLDPNSPCIDVGDPNGIYTGQVDIDGDDRVIDIAGKGDGNVDVDMGADEHDPNS